MDDASDAPFDPPYELGGRVMVSLGLLDGDPKLPSDPSLHGFSPIEIGRRAVCVLVASAFDDPPKEMPVRYREVIVALLLRRGARLCVLPLSMQLDQELPVIFGHRYYGLPKTLDPSLAANLSSREVKIEGGALDVEARACSAFAQIALTPARWIFALGIRLFTSQIEIVGVDPPPARSVIVALRPRGGGRALSMRRAALPSGDLAAIFTLYFEHDVTWLGPPAPFIHT